MTQGTCLHNVWPFEVPLELGDGTVTSHGCEAGVTACDAVGDARDQVGNRACLGCVGSGQHMLYEMEVVAEVAADVVEEHAAMDRLGGRSRMVSSLDVASMDGGSRQIARRAEQNVLMVRTRWELFRRRATARGA